MSQEQAAELLGVDKDTLSRWERGLNKPRSPQTIASLKKHYEITQQELDDWFGEWVLREEPSDERYFVRGYEYLNAHGMDEEDLAQALIDIDLSLVPDLMSVDVGTVEQWGPVFRESPFTWKLLTSGERIVGYWQYLCLKDACFARAKEGQLRDSQITVDAIHAPSYLTPAGSYKMYVLMVGVLPAHRHLGAGAKLVASLIREVQRAALNGLFFEEFVAVAHTPQGLDLCRGFGLVPRAMHVSTSAGAAPAQVFHATWDQVISSQPFAGAPKVRAAYSARFGLP